MVHPLDRSLKHEFLVRGIQLIRENAVSEYLQWELEVSPAPRHNRREKAPESSDCFLLDWDYGFRKTCREEGMLHVASYESVRPEFCKIYPLTNIQQHVNAVVPIDSLQPELQASFGRVLASQEEGGTVEIIYIRCIDRENCERNSSLLRIRNFRVFQDTRGNITHEDSLWTVLDVCT